MGQIRMGMVQPSNHIRKCFRKCGIRGQPQEDDENQPDEDETQYSDLLDGMTVAGLSELDANVETTFTADDK